MAGVEAPPTLIDNLQSLSESGRWTFFFFSGGDAKLLAGLQLILLCATTFIPRSLVKFVDCRLVKATIIT